MARSRWTAYLETPFAEGVAAPAMDSGLVRAEGQLLAIDLQGRFHRLAQGEVFAISTE